MRVALTSVHPTSRLHPLHPGWPQGMGMGSPACWRGAGTGCKPFVPPRPAPQSAPNGGGPKPPPALSIALNKANDALDGDRALDRQLGDCIRPGLAFKIHFGALLMELLLVSLSSQCHRVLMHFRQGTCSSFFRSLHALKIRVFRQRASLLNDPVGLYGILRAFVS